MPIDYKKYPSNWLSEIRPRIMRRAENKCEVCGLVHGSIVYRIKLWVKDTSDAFKAQYKYTSIWFQSESDAMREDRHQTVRPVKVVLTIAHLDHDELNHQVSDDRLKAMCQVCHLRYDAKEKYRRSLKKQNL